MHKSATSLSRDYVCITSLGGWAEKWQMKFMVTIKEQLKEYKS